MGRYYGGDIEGKFWFGVQNSDDASFFGGEQIEPCFIEYRFEKDRDWETLCEGLQTCLRELGDYKEKLDSFFEQHDSYNDAMLAEALNIKEVKVLPLLEWYARLELGEKIKHCLQKHGECAFQAEL